MTAAHLHLEARHRRDGGRLALDAAYELRRVYPDARISDYVEEETVKLDLELESPKRPQDLSRELLAWLTQTFHTRLERADVTVGGSTVSKNFALLRPTLAERSMTTHARAKGDPWVDVD